MANIGARWPGNSAAKWSTIMTSAEMRIDGNCPALMGIVSDHDAVRERDSDISAIKAFPKSSRDGWRSTECCGGLAVGPEEVKAMTTAYEEVLKELKVTDRSDLLTRSSLENNRVRTDGERDPARLRDVDLKSIAS
jgi:hypothetical protein